MQKDPTPKSFQIKNLITETEKDKYRKKHRFSMQYFGLQLTKGNPIVLEWSKFKSKKLNCVKTMHYKNFGNPPDLENSINGVYIIVMLCKQSLSSVDLMN